MYNTNMNCNLNYWKLLLMNRINIMHSTCMQTIPRLVMHKVQVM